MKFIFVLLGLIFIVGCTSVNTLDEHTYNSLKCGIDEFEVELINYWNADKTLSYRDRNTKEIKMKNLKIILNSIKIKKDN